MVLGWTWAYASSFVLKEWVPGWKFNFPLSSVFLGLGVSFVLGLIFGLFPAVKASKKSPIEAMRYE